MVTIIRRGESVGRGDNRSGSGPQCNITNWAGNLGDSGDYRRFSFVYLGCTGIGRLGRFFSCLQLVIFYVLGIFHYWSFGDSAESRDFSLFLCQLDLSYLSLHALN